jgi:hypothetical protein
MRRAAVVEGVEKDQAIGFRKRRLLQKEDVKLGKSHPRASRNWECFEDN